MSFLQKFKTKTGLGLEAELDQRIFVERAHRIRLIRPRDLVCRLEVKGELHSVKVKDVSESGIGFLTQDFPSVQKGEVHNAFFVSGGDESFPAQIEVIRTSDRVVGVRFLGHQESWRAFLRNHFELELEAGTLHLVDSSLLKVEEEGQVWWFFSPEGGELYMIIDEDRLIRYHLVFRGHHFDGDEFSFRYGKILNEEKKPVAIKSAHQVIPQPGVRPPVEAAKRFLSNIEFLPENYLKQVLTSLSK